MIEEAGSLSKRCQLCTFVAAAIEFPLRFALYHRSNMPFSHQSFVAVCSEEFELKPINRFANRCPVWQRNGNLGPATKRRMDADERKEYEGRERSPPPGDARMLVSQDS